VANRTYPIPQNDQTRMDEAMLMLAQHMPTYREMYNAELVSITRAGNQWNVVLSNPLPDFEARHIRLIT
jgi:hypothetical protein